MSEVMIRNIETLSLKGVPYTKHKSPSLGSKNLATGRHALQHGCVLRQIYLPVSSTPLRPPPPQASSCSWLWAAVTARHKAWELLIFIPSRKAGSTG